MVQVTVPSSSPFTRTVQVPSKWSWSNSRIGKIYVLNIDKLITEIFYNNFTNLYRLPCSILTLQPFQEPSSPHVPWEYSMPVSPSINSPDSGQSDVVAIWHLSSLPLSEYPLHAVSFEHKSLQYDPACIYWHCRCEAPCGEQHLSVVPELMYP